MVNLGLPWELLWAVPIIGGILALWMLRRKRQDVVVSSLIVWQALLQDTQTNTPLRKIRRNLLLFLQLLAAFLLLFALARPFVYGHGLTGRTLVIIVDNSASMAATDVRPSRLQAAKDAAKGFLRHELSGTDAATVITAGARPETVIGLTTDSARLEDAVDKIAGTDAPGDLTAALTLALALVHGREGARIQVFTDGTLGPDDAARLAALNFGGTEVRQESIGSQSAGNVAITALDARRNPETGRAEVFVGVRRFGSGAQTGGTLSLFLNGKRIDARAVDTQEGRDDETFDSALLSNGGVVTARLEDVRDDLATDNAASLVLSPPGKKRILLVSAGNFFLEKALNSDPDTTLAECAPAQFATEGRDGKGYALVVFDGFVPAEAMPPVNALVFAAGNAQTPLAPTGGDVRAPALLDENTAHPVMRFVDLHGVHVRAALKTVARPGATILAEGQGGPWIAAQEGHGHRIVSVAFDLSDTDWPLRVAFPIFVANAVDWLAQGGQPGVVNPETAAGQPLSVVVPPNTGSVTVTMPDGHVRTIAAPPRGGVVSFAATDRVGVYHVRVGGTADYPAAVDLLNPTVSDLGLRAVAALDHPGVAPAPSSVPLAKRARNELWPAAAAVALAVLMLEWVVYHRRIGG